MYIGQKLKSITRMLMSNNDASFINLKYKVSNYTHFQLLVIVKYCKGIK